MEYYPNYNHYFNREHTGTADGFIVSMKKYRPEGIPRTVAFDH